MNRRSFVQTLGAGAVGLSAFESTTLFARGLAQAPAAASVPLAPSLANLIRIGSNENPYGPAPSAIQAVTMASPGANRYPGPLTQKLVTTIADKHKVPVEQVLLSGGSGDILAAVVTAFTGKTKALVTGLPSYEAPVRTAKDVGAPLKEIPLTSELRLDLPKMTAAAAGAGLVYICNPNNPTATAVSASAVTATIEAVVKASPATYILVDEAYFEYSDLPGFDTAVPLVAKYPNVIVARTFSKIHGMAGMRVGYAIAQPKTLEAIRAFHSNSGLSSMSLAAATASLEDKAHMAEQAVMNREVRAMTVAAFEKAGYTVAPSDANFIFVDIKRDTRRFADSCRKAGVAVGRAFPPLTNYARISIGTKAEMEKAIPVFMQVLGAPPNATAYFHTMDDLPTELT